MPYSEHTNLERKLILFLVSNKFDMCLNKKIADYYGVNSLTIKKWLELYEIALPKRQKKINYDLLNMLHERLGDPTVYPCKNKKQLAQEYDVTAKTLSKWIKEDSTTSALFLDTDMYLFTPKQVAALFALYG